MARVDFLEAAEQLNQIGILRVATDFYMQPKRRGTTWFVKSPVSEDRHWSCALNPAANRFTDFANTNTGGDTVRFVAYVKRCDNWCALRMLKDFYGLTGIRERSQEDIRRRIFLQQQAEIKKQAREREFKMALHGRISQLKQIEVNYKRLLQKKEIWANDDVLKWLFDELNMIGQKLDILCGTAPDYRRMKPCVEYGISSDRPRWLLCVLKILEEDDMFLPTEEERMELQSQAEFEAKRKSGLDRRCRVEW